MNYTNHEMRRKHSKPLNREYLFLAPTNKKLSKIKGGEAASQSAFCTFQVLFCKFYFVWRKNKESLCFK